MGMPAIVEDWTGRLTGAQLGQAITLLSAQMNAANHRLLRMIAEFDRCGGWRLDGSMRSCAHWLVAHCGITLGAAREKVRVARQLEVLPEVNGVFSEGGISYSKVRAITRVATPENEGFMVHLAEQNTAGHLERLVSRCEPVPEPGLAGLLDCGSDEVAPAGGSDQAAGRGAVGVSDDAVAGISADAAESGATPPPLDAEAMREMARELYWFQDKDGMWILHAKLPPEQGQLVIKALQAVARPLAEERQEEWQARQKARMQEVARTLLQRRDTRADAGLEDGVRQADPGVDAAGQAEPGLGEGGGAGPEEPLASSAGEAIPNHIAYARAEKKSPRRFFRST